MIKINENNYCTDEILTCRRQIEHKNLQQVGI